MTDGDFFSLVSPSPPRVVRHVGGGNPQYDPFHSHRKTSAFDPAAETFTDMQNMAHGRCYPTLTASAIEA